MLWAISSIAFALPPELTGAWIQPKKNERGAMRIVITEPGVTTLKGSMEIRGSPYCGEPIRFRGTIYADKVLIENEDEIVCGYRGKLTGEVVKDSEFAYKGKFVYTFWGFTWAEGTFRMVPLEKVEK